MTLDVVLKAVWGPWAWFCGSLRYGLNRLLGAPTEALIIGFWGLSVAASIDRVVSGEVFTPRDWFWWALFRVLVDSALISQYRRRQQSTSPVVGPAEWDDHDPSGVLRLATSGICWFVVWPELRELYAGQLPLVLPIELAMVTVLLGREDDQGEPILQSLRRRLAARRLTLGAS